MTGTFTSNKINRLIQSVSSDRLKSDIYHLAKDPLPYRKVNFTIQGHEKNTLAETDNFIHTRLEALGYSITRESCRVQAFRCDRQKPLHHWYSPPMPEDPWYLVDNIYAINKGKVYPNEIIVIISHKDSPSWYDSPGAYDNAVGVAANLEIARIMAEQGNLRTICHLFCNEEHSPWTSVTAAENARERGDSIISVINLDAIGGKSYEDFLLGKKTNVSRFCTPEGAYLASLMKDMIDLYQIPLIQEGYKWDQLGDDDGSYIRAGFLNTIINIGSFPYMDPNYHMEDDIPENVDFENVTLTTQATLAAIAHILLFNHLPF